MVKRTRTILFILCVALFSLLAPAVVWYSQGYRVDFEEKRIVQTGGFYFKTLPSGAEVYLNDKLKDKTSGFTSSVLIENLLPKRYQVQIKKDGYHTWQKSLAVKERRVTEAKNIVLIPQTIDFALTDGLVPEIETSATSSDQNKVIEFNDYEIWIDFPEEEEKAFLTRFSEKIDQVLWLTNYYLIFNVNDKIKIAEIDDRDGLNMVEIAEFENPKIFWDEKDKKLYILSRDKLYLSENLLP